MSPLTLETFSSHPILSPSISYALVPFTNVIDPCKLHTYTLKQTQLAYNNDHHQSEYNAFVLCSERMSNESCIVYAIFDRNLYQTTRT